MRDFAHKNVVDGRVTMERSTVAATLGGATTVILAWVLKTQFGQEIPADVGAAITTVIMTLLTHFVPDSKAAKA
jgi:ABC-type spermidine/putrescine transport system permease subunit I